MIATIAANADSPMNARPRSRDVDRSLPYRAAVPLDAAAFADVRRQTVWQCCKWDPQFEDQCVLCDYPLVLRAAEWTRLARLAESLAAETLDAERELLAAPRLHGLLGLPRALRRALRQAAHDPPPDGPRVMRFDFHFTTAGWQISEVNSDVPGGFIEASGFTRCMAARFTAYRLAGDPAAAYAEALARGLPPGAAVAFVHATAYTDDRQVMIYLTRFFEARGLRCFLASPADLCWEPHRVTLRAATEPVTLAAIVRFFPAEWLPNLPRSCGRGYFSWSGGHGTQLSNPAMAILTQSKRFPLAWPHLASPLPVWRRLLPETVDPRRVRGASDADWVFKPALGRVGEDVGIAGVTRADQWRRIRRAVRWWPSDWAAQRRFEAVPLPGPRGSVFPQLGVYTIAGRAAGIYGRLSVRPLIDCHAQDVAVLVEDDAAESRPTDHGETPC